MAKLDAEQREILILRELQELSYDEISEILELPLGTVKSRMHRARTTLSKLLSPHINLDDLETKMNPLFARNRISDYLDGELSPAELSQLKTHSRTHKNFKSNLSA